MWTYEKLENPYRAIIVECATAEALPDREYGPEYETREQAQSAANAWVGEMRGHATPLPPYPIEFTKDAEDRGVSVYAILAEDRGDAWFPHRIKHLSPELADRVASYLGVEADGVYGEIVRRLGVISQNRDAAKHAAVTHMPTWWASEAARAAVDIAAEKLVRMLKLEIIDAANSGSWIDRVNALPMYDGLLGGDFQDGSYYWTQGTPRLVRLDRVNGRVIQTATDVTRHMWAKEFRRRIHYVQQGEWVIPGRKSPL